VLADFARYQGCLLGVPLPSDAEAPARVLALAQGTGDPAWPHTCAHALTRLEHTTDDMHGDDAESDALATSIRRAQNGLGEAVFWNAHVQDGHAAAPTWLASYAELRAAVERFARAHGASLLPPEAPRRPRIPRAADAVPPPPRPVALTGGTGADLVDATATPTMFSLVMRDERSREAICRWPLTPADAPIECARFTLSNAADPRYAAFVPSERGPYLAVWGRAPESVRDLVDADAQRVVMSAAGDPDATRDFFVGISHATALQIDREGPALLVETGGRVERVTMPRALDVLTADRALLGDVRGGGLETWLDVRSHATTTLYALALDENFHVRGAPVVSARWAAPRMHGPDRRIVPCSVPGGARYLAAGDRAGGVLFVADESHRLQRGPEISIAFDPPPRIACDAQGITFASEGTPVRFAHCDVRACVVREDIPISSTYAMTRTHGALVLADIGPDSTLRVRIVDVSTGAVRASPLGSDPPTARDVRLASRDADIALFVTDHETFAYRSTDGGATFRPAVVER
jgi:hypothetical protein